MWWYGRSSRENYLLRIFRLGFRLRRIFKLPPLRSRAKQGKVWESVASVGKVWASVASVASGRASVASQVWLLPPQCDGSSTTITFVQRLENAFFFCMNLNVMDDLYDHFIFTCKNLWAIFQTSTIIILYDTTIIVVLVTNIIITYHHRQHR